MLYKWVNRPSTLRRLFNIYPPFVGAGISVRRISDDWREADVRLALRWYNRNYVGTSFGGSLFTMTDPFHMLLLLHILGSEYRVWDAAATIRFVKPGASHVYAYIRIDDALIDTIRGATADGKKYFAEVELDVVDAAGEVVAAVSKTIYVRRKTPRAPA